MALETRIATLYNPIHGFCIAHVQHCLSFRRGRGVIAARAARLARSASHRVERVATCEGLRPRARRAAPCRQRPAPFARSTRDGFACRAAEAATHRPLPVAGSTRAGDAPSGPLPRGAAWEIMTGAPVPRAPTPSSCSNTSRLAAADRSEPSACCRRAPSKEAKTSSPVARKRAKAMRCCPLGAAIGAPQIALAASCGCVELKVFVRPRVAILATGDELVPIKSKPGPGQIRNSSNAMLAAMVARSRRRAMAPAHRARHGKVPRRRAGSSRDADLLLITGGVSAGKFDLVEPALDRAGARFHFTGVRIQPGKPLVFAELGRRAARTVQSLSRTKCCFGLPGNPVSSAVTFLLFGAPVLAATCRPPRTWPCGSALARSAPGRCQSEARTHPFLARSVYLLGSVAPGRTAFPGKAPEIWPPWPGRTVSWSYPKKPTIFTRAISSAFFLSEEFHAQTLEAFAFRFVGPGPHGRRRAPSRPRAAPRPPRHSSSSPRPCLRLCPPIPRAIRWKWRASPASRRPSAPPSSSPCAIRLRSPTSTWRQGRRRRCAHHNHGGHHRSHRRRNGGAHRRRRRCAHGLRHDQGARQSHRHSRDAPRIQIRRQKRKFLKRCEIGCRLTRGVQSKFRSGRISAQNRELP